MKGFAFIVLMVSSTNYFTPKEKESINYDENRQLTWSDYQARPNKASSFKALTATVVSFSAKSDGKTLQLTLQNTFEPHNSWTKTAENVALLEHERLHFQLSELYARKLRKEILETKFKSSGQKLMNDIGKLYEKKMQELTVVQRKYDKETDHSINQKEQKEWEIKIKTQLAELRKYSIAEITIEL